MVDKLLKYIPKTLQEDFVDNKVVPFIGAGFSKNAIMLDGADILDWNGLGRAMAAFNELNNSLLLRQIEREVNRFLIA